MEEGTNPIWLRLLITAIGVLSLTDFVFWLYFSILKVCQSYLQSPFFITLLFLLPLTLALSLSSFTSCFKKAKWLMYVSGLAMFLLFSGLTYFTFELKSFQQKYIYNEKNLSAISNCMINSHVCSSTSCNDKCGALIKTINKEWAISYIFNIFVCLVVFFALLLWCCTRSHRNQKAGGNSIEEARNMNPNEGGNSTSVEARTCRNQKEGGSSTQEARSRNKKEGAGNSTEEAWTTCKNYFFSAFFFPKLNASFLFYFMIKAPAQSGCLMAHITPA